MICCTCHGVRSNSFAIAGNDGRNVSIDSGLTIDRLASSTEIAIVGRPLCPVSRIFT